MSISQTRKPRSVRIPTGKFLKKENPKKKRKPQNLWSLFSIPCLVLVLPTNSSLTLDSPKPDSSTQPSKFFHCQFIFTGPTHRPLFPVTIYTKVFQLKRDKQLDQFGGEKTVTGRLGDPCGGRARRAEPSGCPATLALSQEPHHTFKTDSSWVCNRADRPVVVPWYMTQLLVLGATGLYFQRSNLGGRAGWFGGTSLGALLFHETQHLPCSPKRKPAGSYS